MSEYNFAFLDEQSKRMIRRAILKAVAIPGYQVPFGSREMPLSYGWGTGGVQVTASVIGPADVLKVIDPGRRAQSGVRRLTLGQHRRGRPGAARSARHPLL
jgi:alpha-D-ribose 1-methylphosphonate 5-phosphate C-P lyase